MGRQVQEEFAAASLDDLAHPPSLGGTEVVHHHHLPWLKRRGEYPFEVSLEHPTGAGRAATWCKVLGKKLEKRLLKLEQALPGVGARAPYWEDFERRCRIADLYRAWFEVGKRPDLSYPRNRLWWEYMEMTWKGIDEMAAKGILGAHPDE